MPNPNPIALQAASEAVLRRSPQLGTVAAKNLSEDAVVAYLGAEESAITESSGDVYADLGVQRPSEGTLALMSKMNAEIATLRKALEPFAIMARDYSDRQMSDAHAVFCRDGGFVLTKGHLRIAACAYSGAPIPAPSKPLRVGVLAELEGDGA